MSDNGWCRKRESWKVESHVEGVWFEIGNGTGEVAGSTGRFKSGYGPFDCAAVLLHGSKSPTRVLISLEVRCSSFRGESRQDLSLTISKTAHNGFPLFSGAKGRERESLLFSLFFFLFFIPSWALFSFSPESSDLSDYQVGGHLFPVTNTLI